MNSLIDRFPRLPLFVAFAAIYLIWGSTYLAIRIAIETIPPFVMAGARFVLAGSVLYLGLRARGIPAPSLRHWKSAALIGGLMILGGNGMVTWAEKYVASGMAALLVTTVPIWMVMLNATFYSGARPSGLVRVGLLFGLVGVGILIDPTVGEVAPIGAVALLFASFSWANGSLLNRKAELPESPWMAAAMEMISGGLMLFVAATVVGEWSQLDIGVVSLTSLVAMLYLIVFGSIIGLSAYVYLLRATTAAAVGTYAFVNPVIAVALGWMAGETFGPRAMVGASLILGAVILIHWAKARSARAEVFDLPSKPAIITERAA